MSNEPGVDLHVLEASLHSHGVKLQTADEAVCLVAPGHRVMIPIGSQPMCLADALAARVATFEDGAIEISDCAVAANYPWLTPGFPGISSIVHEHWGGPAVRSQLRARLHDYVPIPFSLRFKANAEQERPAAERRDADVVMVQVSLPDAHGFVSFGTNGWNQLQFVEEAGIALAEMTPKVKHANGIGNVAHVSVFDGVILSDSGLRLTTVPDISPEEQRIADYVREVVRDGDTLQIGAGTVSTACVYAGAFDGMRDLGWHSEATVGRVIELIREGVINGARKTLDRGLAVATGYAGTPEQIEYVRTHPLIHTRSTDYVHNIKTIAAQENMVALNAALSVDLTGQIAADSIGTEMVGGTGGQLEFAIGAINAQHGRSITVLESTALRGTQSTIVDVHPAGTVVSVPRLFADIIITEYGIARLWGKPLRERATELVRVAHPMFRDQLRRRAKELLG